MIFASVTCSFTTPDRFVTKIFLQSLFRSLSESFVHVIQETSHIPSMPWVQIQRKLTFFKSSLLHYLDNESLWDVYQPLLPEIFLLGSFINKDDEDSFSVSSICLNIWSGFLSRSPENLLVLVKSNLRARLRFHAENTSSWSQ